ncbi:MAG: winged helix-turn-helix transcriptional regulator, partial [Alphaproteobacteria bacterium]
MDINLLVKVSAKAWSFDVLAILCDGTAGRQASLISKTGAGRTAVQNSLNHLIELGLVKRNSGHGHPLRPEYVLTSLGRRCGETALRIKNLVPVASNRLILNRTWTLPVLAT